MHKLSWLIMIALLGCSDGKGGKSRTGGVEQLGANQAEALVSKLRECKLVTEGKLTLAASTTHQERCEVACALKAECGEVRLLLCDGDERDGREVLRCLEECEGEPIACKDGSNDDLLEKELCDGIEHCANGEDEDCASSPHFTCADGGRIPIAAECDGARDCDDESDEASCSAGFACGDGQFIRSELVCNLSSDCDNDADEQQGCATTICGG